MATFKVGDKVRIVGALRSEHQASVGAETTITSRRFRHYEGYAYRTALTDQMRGCAGVHEAHLRPRTDPRASDFIADMRRFAALSRKKVTA